MKTKGKKMVITLACLILVATVTYAASMLGAGVFWSSLASGVVGTLGGHIKNNA
jgi:hypothetical protein